MPERINAAEEAHQDDPERAHQQPLLQNRPRSTWLPRGTGAAAMGERCCGKHPVRSQHAGRADPGGAHAQGAPRLPPPKGPQYLKFPGKNEGLVVLGEKPLVAETPESLLDDDTTPIEKFYIRNNGQIPEEAKDPDAWKITIDGEVNNKIEITLGELKSKYKAVTRRMVLECGGNGRAAFSPPARGNQWTNGGAGCAEWTGVPLADLLKKAGLKPSAQIHRALCGRSASVGRRRQADHLARRAHRKGDGPEHDDRVGHERQAAAEHPWRAGAPDRAGLGRLGLAEMADAHHHPRQGA